MSFLVLSEPGASVKSTATITALIGLFSRVNSLVNHQARVPSEYFLTLVTFMQFLAGVCSPVARVHRAIRGASVLVPPLNSHVGPQVLHKVGAPAKGLATLAADIGLHTCVDDLVLEEGGIMAEGLPALTALVGPLACVDPLVDGELRAHAEGLSALHALIGLLTLVDPLVVDEAGALAEGFPAIVAFVGLLPNVDPLMLTEV